jgi:hypothetical protein
MRTRTSNEKGPHVMTSNAEITPAAPAGEQCLESLRVGAVTMHPAAAGGRI